MNGKLTFLLGALWLGLIATGFGMLMVHDYSAGKDTPVSTFWPADSHLPHVDGRPTLIMFAHPRCPCTRASLEELKVVMQQCQGRMTAYIVFLQPEGKEEEWSHTELRQSAEAIPGVTVRSDDHGHEARCFQVETSGHVLLYDARQRLQFSGGITASRGHAGDNRGRTTLVGMLAHGAKSVGATPVFGCPLPDPKPETQGEKP